MEGVEDDEEEQILRENLYLLSLFEVDVERIISKYEPKVFQSTIKNVIGK